MVGEVSTRLWKRWGKWMVDGIVGIDLLIWGFTVVVEVAFRHSASIDFALRVGPIHVEGGIVKLYVDPLP